MHGGGKEMLQKIYDSLMPGKIKVLGCGPERGIYLLFQSEALQIKGFKTVLLKGWLLTSSRAGASPSSIPFRKFTPLEKRIVDAADASVYINNHASGFHKIAAPSIRDSLNGKPANIINKRVWDKMSASEKAKWNL